MRFYDLAFFGFGLVALVTANLTSTKPDCGDLVTVYVTVAQSFDAVSATSVSDEATLASSDVVNQDTALTQQTSSTTSQTIVVAQTMTRSIYQNSNVIGSSSAPVNAAYGNNSPEVFQPSKQATAVISAGEQALTTYFGVNDAAASSANNQIDTSGFLGILITAKTSVSGSAAAKQTLSPALGAQTSSADFSEATESVVIIYSTIEVIPVPVGYSFSTTDVSSTANDSGTSASKIDAIDATSSAIELTSLSNTVNSLSMFLSTQPALAATATVNTIAPPANTRARSTSTTCTQTTSSDESTSPTSLISSYGTSTDVASALALSQESVPTGSSSAASLSSELSSTSQYLATSFSTTSSIAVSFPSDSSKVAPLFAESSSTSSSSITSVSFAVSSTVSALSVSSSVAMSSAISSQSISYWDKSSLAVSSLTMAKSDALSSSTSLTTSLIATPSSDILSTESSSFADISSAEFSSTESIPVGTSSAAAVSFTQSSVTFSGYFTTVTLSSTVYVPHEVSNSAPVSSSTTVLSTINSDLTSTLLSEGPTFSSALSTLSPEGSITFSGLPTLTSESSLLASSLAISTAQGSVLSPDVTSPESITIITSIIISSVSSAFRTAQTSFGSGSLITTSSTGLNSASIVDESSLTNSVISTTSSSESTNTAATTEGSESTSIDLFPSSVPSLPSTFVTSTLSAGSDLTSGTTTGVSSSASASSTSCGNIGKFPLDFDDLPPLAAPSDTPDPMPIFSPYHKFSFDGKFVVVPPPTDPYLPASGKLLLEFIPVTNTDNSAEISNYYATFSNCFNFNAESASLGCDSTGPECDWEVTGLRWNLTSSTEEIVAHQFLSTPSCPALKDCSLVKVNFDASFEGLTKMLIRGTVAGVEKMWWMDSMDLAWTDNRCATGLCRANTRP